MSGAPSIDEERPWPGLLPFTEDTHMFFHGREAEADELFRLIEREALTVLFGQSGLGKSSLLNAGVFPRLRRAGYLPVYLRLTFEAAAPPLLDQVWQALLRECAKNDAIASPAQPGDGLWEYLHRPDTRFLNPYGRPVTPVLVFDQFEEIFTLGRQTPELAARTETFVDQLGDLIENRVPPALESRLTDDPELLDHFDLLRQNVKLLFSFREDYLADFEGLKNRIRPIMQNRMRLTRMRGDRAAEAIRTSGAGRLSAKVAARIVEYVAGTAGGETVRLEDLSIEPALLSLVCRELNEQRIARQQSEISGDLIQGENTRQIIAGFYAEGFTGLAVEVRYFVEDRLLTTEGHRDSCALDNALAEPGVSETAIQTLVDRRILRREERAGQVRLELIHDVLAVVAKASRDARREESALAGARLQLAKQRRRQQTIGACAVILLAVLAAVSWLAVTAHRESIDAKRQAAAALAAQQKAEDEKKRADQQQFVAKQQAVRAINAEKLAESNQRYSSIAFAAAYEQLDKHGTVEQTKACIDATNRLSQETPPPASREFMASVWHVQQGTSLTYTDWRADGTCVNKHVFENGKELDLAGDICTWQYKKTGEYEFDVDFKSKKMTQDYPKHLPFKIVSPIEIHNTQLDYSAIRILCPVQEIAYHRQTLAQLQQRAAASSKPDDESNVGNELDKIAWVLQAQGHLELADPAYLKEIDYYQGLLQRDAANPTWQRGLAWANMRYADNAIQEKRYAPARDHYQQAVSLYDSLHGKDDDAYFDAFASEGLGRALNELGAENRPASREAFQRSIRQFDALAAKYPGNPEIEVDAARALYLLSTVSTNDDAKAALQKAIGVVDALQKAHQLPETAVGLPGFLRLEFAKH